ncbi:MAG: hypothetical protein L0Z07_01855, partial [Planctomycetes bacterium]|nr:hypothetical protein [Planctomycetota bacterium]
SALTNAAVALGLNGKRLTAPELQSMLREKFPGMALKTPPEAREDTIFQFAYQDAVRFHIADGKLELAIAIDDFQQAGHRIRGFVVHAYYVPVLTGLQADLVRDGAIGIEGRLGSTERARLHSVFKEILTEERRLPLIRLEDPADPRIAGLMVSQLVLEDGWLGLAIGPEANGRVAERSHSLR